MRNVEHIERFERATAPPRSRSVATFLSVVMVAGLGLAYLQSAQQPSSALAGPVAWSQRLPDALAQSKQATKPVLLRFTADWCGPCRQMDREVYGQDAIAQRLNRYTVPALIDLTQPDEATNRVAVQYHVRSIPTALLIDAEGNTLSRLDGGVDAKTFQRWLDMNGL